MKRNRIRTGAALIAILALLLTAVLPVPALAEISGAWDADWQPALPNQVLALGQGIAGLQVNVVSDNAAEDFTQALGFVAPNWAYAYTDASRVAATLTDMQGSPVDSPENNTPYVLKADGILRPSDTGAQHIGVAAGGTPDTTAGVQSSGSTISPYTCTCYVLTNGEQTFPWTHEISAAAGIPYAVQTPADIRWGLNPRDIVPEPVFTALADGAEKPVYAWTVSKINGGEPAGGTDLAANGITIENGTSMTPVLTFSQAGTYELLCTATNFLEAVGADGAVLSGSDAPHLSVVFNVQGVGISPAEQTVIQYGPPVEISLEQVLSGPQESLSGYWTVTGPDGRELSDNQISEQLQAVFVEGMGSPEAGVPTTKAIGIQPTSLASLDPEGYTFAWTGTGKLEGVGPLVSKLYVTAPVMRISSGSGAYTDGQIIPGSDAFTLTGQIAVPGDDPAYVDAPSGSWKITNPDDPDSETIDFAYQLGIEPDTLRDVSIQIDPKSLGDDAIIGTPYTLTFSYSSWKVSTEVTVQEPLKGGTLQIVSDAADNTVTVGAGAQAVLRPQVWGLLSELDWSDWTNGTWTLPEGTTDHQWGLSGAALTEAGAITIAPAAELLENQPEGGYRFEYAAEINGEMTVAQILIQLVQGTEKPSLPEILQPGAGSLITVSGGYASGITVSPEGITVKDYLEAFNMTLPEEGAEVCVAGALDEILADDAVVCTGCTLQLVYSETGAVADSAGIILAGDVLGTGIMDIQQVIRMAEALNHVRPLEGVCLQAGDFNSSGSIDIADLEWEAQLLNGEARRLGLI